LNIIHAGFGAYSDGMRALLISMMAAACTPQRVRRMANHGHHIGLGEAKEAIEPMG